MEENTKTCGLLGLAGYIAPRHLRAMRGTNCQLISACDPCDSVGLMDSYYPECSFFTDMAFFDSFNRQAALQGHPLDYIAICSPNHFHEPHCHYALRLGANAICEKPLALTTESLQRMMATEQQTGRKIYTILQLRLHQAIKALREKIEADKSNRVYDVDLTYITARGNWYYASWKGDIQKSGGIATNIGIHFFDMLTWIFGPLQRSVVHVLTDSTCAGYLELPRARVRYFLSIDARNLPPNAVEGEKRTYRTLSIDGDEFEFSAGFTELHTESYRQIFAGNGFRPTDVQQCIEIVEGIRHAVPVGLKGDYHPLLRK